MCIRDSYIHSVPGGKRNILGGETRDKNNKTMLYKHRAGNSFFSSCGQVKI